MATLTADQQKLSDLYEKNFGKGRTASFDAKGGASYWLDTHKPTSQSDWDNIDRMLAGSDEGLKFAGKKAGWDRAGQVSHGGVDPTKSIHSQIKAGDNTWLNHWAPGGALAPKDIDDTFTELNKSISTANPSGNYFNFDSSTFKPDTGSGTGNSGNVTITPVTGPKKDDGWWTKFADADAFKKFLSPDDTKSDGMGDFMKFMMLMNVMGGNRGGGGYGGSQYGYGGLNPGGVQAAYDPVAQLKGMGTWFKDNFGSTKATTQTINT